MALNLTTPAFGEDEKIPLRYTGDGEDVNPPLNWSGVPEGTRELALICDDPDAPSAEPWVHWVIYGIASDVAGLPEELPREGRLTRAFKAAQGINSWGKCGYGGPYPPKGHGVHRYRFTLYALGQPLGAEPGLDKPGLLKAIAGVPLLGQVTLTGTYQR